VPRAYFRGPKGKCGCGGAVSGVQVLAKILTFKQQEVSRMW
jgi:hypothetical protein